MLKPDINVELWQLDEPRDLSGGAFVLCRLEFDSCLRGDQDGKRTKSAHVIIQGGLKRRSLQFVSDYCWNTVSRLARYRFAYRPRHG
jgi:hypothetical protein